MAELHTFLQGADNYLGVFYPNGYLREAPCWLFTVSPRSRQKGCMGAN